MEKTTASSLGMSAELMFFSEKSAFVLDSFDCCPVGIMIIYRNKNLFERMNRKCMEIFDLKAEDVQRGDLKRILAAVQGQHFDETLVDCNTYPIFSNINSRIPQTLKFSIRRDGQKRIIKMNSSPVIVNDAIVGVVSTVEDITDLIISQNKLECAMARLENLWHVSKNRFLTIKEVCDITLESIGEITKSTYGFFGFLDEDETNMIIHSWSGETMKGCMVIDQPFVYPIKDAGLWAEAIRQRRPLVVNDYSQCDLPKKGYPEGHVTLKNLMVIPHFIGKKINAVAAVANKELNYTDEDVTRITEFLNDIQSVIKQIEAEELLKKSEKKYRNLVELMNEGILVLNAGQVVTFVNTKLAKILGYEPDAVIGQDFNTFLHPDSRDNFRQQQLLRKDGLSESYEMILVNKRGEKIFVLSSPTVLLDDNSAFSGSYEVITNISNIKLIEMQLVHSQKMETIGVMAAGIAHEINTPLQYIVGNTGFVKEITEKMLALVKTIQCKCAEATATNSQDTVAAISKMIEAFDLDFVSKEVPCALNESIEGLDRISSIVLSVKKFAHPEVDTLTSVDVNAEIKNTITVSRNEWKYNAELVTNFTDNIPHFMCIASDFNQIILNLIVNAAHAIQKKCKGSNNKGIITIATSYDKHFICISVADNGSGIDDKIKGKIFNPFFTTKEVGKGTGMGLAIVLKLVEKHQGKIWFESKEGEGTIFYVQFPLTKNQEAVARDATAC